MRVVAKVDASGNFLEEHVLENGQALPASCVAQRPPEGFYAPKWTGSAWEEGKPEGEIVVSLKEARINEFAARAVEDLDATGLFTSEHGDRETLFVIANTLKAICTQLNVPLDARLDAIATTGEKAMQKKAQVGAATTVSEVEAISWT